MFRRSARTAVLCAGFFVAGCATTPDPTQRAYFDQQAADARQSQASLVVDGCVIRDEIGDDYVLRHASRDVGTKSAQAVSDYLVSQGYRVSPAVVPFICGSVKKTTEAVRVADDSESEPVETHLPIPMIDRMGDNLPLSDAYHQMIMKVVDAVAATSKESSTRQGKPTSLGLTPEQLATLRQDLGNERVWVVRAGGVQVSAAKTVGVGTLTTVLSLALSGGTYVYTSTVTDGNGYDVALLNLGTNEIIWKKHLQVQAGDPAALGTYDVAWTKNLFDPFLAPSAGTSKGVAIETSAAAASTPVQPEPAPQSTADATAAELPATQPGETQPSAASTPDQAATVSREEK